MKWKAATERAELFIRTKYLTNPEVRVTIYTWNSHPNERARETVLGIRVAEVSFWKGSGITGSGAGSSFMQVDVPWGAAVCLLAERLIIAYAENWPKEEIEEEEERLLYALKQ